MPTTKKHEYFIPYPEGSEKRFPSFELSDAVASFHDLADVRTAEDDHLPFEVQGSHRNGTGDPNNKLLRLRAGDLVFFAPDPANPKNVGQVSVSSIWRAGNGQTHLYFSTISPELLPHASRRQFLTLAEQLFGTVEVRNKRQQQELSDHAGFALASRVRFHHGRVHTSLPEAPTSSRMICGRPTKSACVTLLK